MDIEIFPAEKSCEQGCSICPLARKDTPLEAMSIDTKVQSTFSLVERVLRSTNTKYRMHLTSKMHLFPKVRYKPLVQMVRLENSKEIYQPGKPAEFSQQLRETLLRHRIQPTMLGFSIVPDFPIVSEIDQMVIHDVLSNLTSWYFLSGYKGIDVTVRSNLIRKPLFEAVAPKLFDADNQFLKNVVQQHSTIDNTQNIAYLTSKGVGHVYQTRYVGRSGTNKITLTNRVIAAHEAKSEEKSMVNQMYEMAPLHSGELDIAIAPRGVMLMHSSLSINNPIFWMTHYDFQKNLHNLSRKPQFALLDFTRKMLKENAVMYEVLKKCNIPVEKFKYYFQHHRSKIACFKTGVRHQ